MLRGFPKFFIILFFLYINLFLYKFSDIIQAFGNSKGVRKLFWFAYIGLHTNEF